MNLLQSKLMTDPVPIFSMLPAIHLMVLQQLGIPHPTHFDGRELEVVQLKVMASYGIVQCILEFNFMEKIKIYKLTLARKDLPVKSVNNEMNHNKS